MKLSKGIQFFAPPPELFKLYLSDNYYISIGSDFDPTFTVGENFIEGDYSFNASSSGTATDIDYTVSGNKITFTKNIAGIGYTDFNSVNVAVGGTFSSSSTSSHTFYVIPSAATQTTYDLTNLNLSAGNYAITVVAEAEGYTDSDASNSVNYSVQAQLATPTIAMNADGRTLEITDVENATSYDVYVDGTLKTNVVAQYIGKFTTYTSGESGVGKPVILSYGDKEYILIPTAPYEVLEQQLAVKPGDKITWSVNSGSINVINNVNCTVTGTYTQHGFAQPTSNNWQLSTSFSV